MSRDSHELPPKGQITNVIAAWCSECSRRVVVWMKDYDAGINPVCAECRKKPPSKGWEEDCSRMIF